MGGGREGASTCRVDEHQMKQKWRTLKCRLLTVDVLLMSTTAFRLVCLSSAFPRLGATFQWGKKQQSVV